jgi:isoleucyl-tRNA synthetase
MAPILTFTAEEIYKYLPESARKYDTIQLEEWPKLNINKDENLIQKWNLILSVRDDVTKALEEKRREKFIGNSLEAKVIIEPKNEEIKEALSSTDPYLLSDVFITSQIEINNVEKGFEGEKVKVAVVKAEGEKCERCWKIDPKTGEDEQHEGTCPRCAAVLRGEREN